MGIKSKFMRLKSWWSYRTFRKAIADPEESYVRLWQEVWGEVGNSPFWKANRPTGVDSERLHVDHFPISDYQTYREALEKSYQGRVSELSGQNILFWCESSGTTGYRKIFPLTSLYMQQLQRTTQPFSYLVCEKFPKLLEQPLLYFAATNPTEQSPAGIDVGFISYYMYNQLPALIQKSYAFPKELYQDGKIFYDWGPLYAMAQELSGLFAITPSMVIQLVGKMESEFDRYFDILSGKTAWPQGLPPISVRPQRLQVIRQAFEQRPVCLKDLWPSLQVITTWKAATCGWQLPALERHNQGRVLVTDGQYSATEGWMTVPFMDSRVGSLLHPGVHIVEFFRADQDPTPDLIRKPWQLKEGEEYEVLLTTAMGFIRYRLYDVVLCKGFVERTPILEFRHKSGHLISLGQSRFSEVNLLTAMQRAGFQPNGQWVFAPADSADRIIFHSDSNQDEHLTQFAAFEQILCELNPEISSDYQTGLLKTMRIELNKNHSFWGKTVQAQAKQKVILKTPFPLE